VKLIKETYFRGSNYSVTATFCFGKLLLSFRKANYISCTAEMARSFMQENQITKAHSILIIDK
jgi:hypothetical protein